MNKRFTHVPVWSENDLGFMKMALRLAEKGRGRTEPNPLVGAVVVQRGEVLATGFHRAFGQGHAERMALKSVDSPGTTLYVSLEPCGHVGKTPPCVDLIVAKKVQRVVVALQDPNPLVNGRGLALLGKKGIETSVGLLGAWAEYQNRHYLKFITRKIPYITLHAGISLDGKLTDKQRQSRWITAAEARRLSHSLRGEFSAILVGRQTVLDDDPQLSLRESGWAGKKLFRVVLDSQNTLPGHLRIFKDQERFPLVIFSSAWARSKRVRTPYHFFIQPDPNGLALRDVCRQLGRLGIASLLVEGGGQVIDSFLRQRLFDEVILFTAGKIVGGKEAVALFATGVERLNRSLELPEHELLELESGFIWRGWRRCLPGSF